MHPTRSIYVPLLLLLLLPCGSVSCAPASGADPETSLGSGGRLIVTSNTGGTANAGAPPVGAGGDVVVGQGGSNLPPPGAGGATIVDPGAGGAGVPVVSAGGGSAVFDAGTDPARNQVPAGQVCDRLATVQCAGEAACCGSPGRDFETCKAAQKTECQNKGYVDAVSLNPIAAYDMGRAEIAFAAFEQKAAACDPSIAVWAASEQGFRGITQGTLDLGASCKAPNLVGDRAGAAAFLAACKDPDNIACLPSLTSWTCEARGQAGTSCFTDANCVDGLYCDNPTPILPPGPTCKVRKPDGASCKIADECASLACVSKSCVPATVQTAYCLKK